MEMTILWDEFDDGNYLPQFTRNYDDFWWATGFVDGQLADLRDTNPIRILGRITFKDAAMADAFVAELKKSGFRRAAGAETSQLVDDSYYQSGADVWFLWSTIYHDCFK